MTPCIDNYRDLPLGVYEQITAIRRDEDIDTQVAVLALLTGRTEADILDLPIGEYTALSAKSAFLYTAPEQKALPRVADAYRVGGFTLVPTKDLRKVTAAQYIDFQEYAKDVEHRFPEILSCFLVPKGCKYNNGYDVLEVQTAIRELSVADALALSAFFLSRYAALIRGTRISLEKARRRERNPERRARMEMELARLTGAWERLTAGRG